MNTFHVQLPSYNNDNNGFYKKAILDTIANKYPWLTVAGLDAPFYMESGKKLRGVQDAGPGSLLTFGTAKNHDVNWVERNTYATEKGYHPILNPITNWNTVMDKLYKFAMERKPLPKVNVYNQMYQDRTVANDRFVIGGKNVTITDDFVFVGTKALPRKLTTNVYQRMDKNTRDQLVGFLVIAEKLFV